MYYPKNTGLLHVLEPEQAVTAVNIAVADTSTDSSTHSVIHSATAADDFNQIRLQETTWTIASNRHQSIALAMNGQTPVERETMTHYTFGGHVMALTGMHVVLRPWIGRLDDGETLSTSVTVSSNLVSTPVFLPCHNAFGDGKSGEDNYISICTWNLEFMIGRTLEAAHSTQPIMCGVQIYNRVSAANLDVRFEASMYAHRFIKSFHTHDGRQ